MEEVKLTNNLAAAIPISLYNYIGGLGNEHFIINHRYFIQNAYSYCINLPKEDLENKMKDIVSKYYKMFLVKRNTKQVNIKVEKPLNNYQATNLVTLYILIYMEDHKDVFGITEENRFNA